LANDFIVHDEYALDGKDIQERPAEGVYVYGLFLEGARWDMDRHTLGDSNPKELYCGMPVIHLAPVEDRQDTMEKIYRCPVYV
jgi:dynein heavy chain